MIKHVKQAPALGENKIKAYFYEGAIYEKNHAFNCCRCGVYVLRGG